MKLLLVNDDGNINHLYKDMDVIVKCDGLTITILKSSNPKLVPEGRKFQQTNENMQKIVAYFM